MGYYYEGKLGLYKSDWDKLNKENRDIIEKEVFNKPVNTFDFYNDKQVYIFSLDRKKYDNFKPQLNIVEEELKDLNIPYCVAIMGEEFDDNEVTGTGELEYMFYISRSINIDK